MATVIKTKERDALRSCICRQLYRDGFDGRENLRRRFAPDKSKNAFDKLVRAEIEAGYLRSHDLAVIPGSRSYLTLGPEGCKALKAPSRFSAPIPESELPYGLGCLAYNSMREPYRKRLLPEEIKKRFPFIGPKFFRWAWLVEHFGTTPVLTTIRVEHRAAVESVVEKLRGQIERFHEHVEFARFIERGRLQVIVVTATREKAHALEAQFRELPEFLTPRMKDAWQTGREGTIRVGFAYYPPLLTLGG